MTTIKDIAKIANVSVATVSRVVNNGPKVGIKTRQRVQQIMDELGYRPNANARALVTNSNDIIGVVIPEVIDPFFAALAHGVDTIAQQNKMQLLISTGSSCAESERKAIQLLQERQCQSIIFHSKYLSDKDLLELSTSIAGLVFINRNIPELAKRCVWLDNEEGGKIAARHLASLNHKDIACISSSYDIDDPKLRLKGFSQELKSQQISLDKSLTVYHPPNHLGGEQAAQALISSGKRFTAIFAYNDAMAIGAISTLEDNGIRVPRDVSVIGFDDVLLSRYSRPKLTTLSYPIIEMAQHAAQLAIAKKQDSNSQKYLPRLIKRESTIDI